MKINNIDIDIIAELYKSERSLTTSSIAKRVYDFGDESDTSISTLDARVRHRLEKLEGYGLVVSEDTDGAAEYSANEGKVICANAEITTSPDFSDNEHEIGMDNLLFLYTDDVFYIAGYMPHSQGPDSEGF